jgi:hypothetical protein
LYFIYIGSKAIVIGPPTPQASSEQ